MKLKDDKSKKIVELLSSGMKPKDVASTMNLPIKTVYNRARYVTVKSAKKEPPTVQSSTIAIVDESVCIVMGPAGQIKEILSTLGRT